MKQYKHIKTGDIATLRTQNGYSLNRSTIGLIPAEYIENSSDWKEIIQKDYEILSFKNKNTLEILNKDSKLKDRFCYKDGKSPFLDLEYCLGCNNYTIHSVKRLSDSEVFTIGDRVTYNNRTSWIINSFSINSDGNLMMAAEGNLDGEWSDINHDSFKKVKTPLFTTEDGVDIFENTKLYYVSPSKYYNINYNCINWTKGSIKQCMLEGGKYFYYQEKAEEYVLMNKLCLTLSEVDKAFCNSFLGDTLMKDLRKLVKSKLEE